MQGFLRDGWKKFPSDPAVIAWLDAAGPAARAAVADPAQAHWMRCEGTWFAGVNILPNDARGAVAGSGPLRGQAVTFLRESLGQRDIRWDRAQVSVIHPGYPRPKDGEGEAAFRFRRDRDAAHVDGLHRDGQGRRVLGETHAFVLGLPLAATGAGASPMVVWQGSHQVMRRAFRAALTGVAPQDWGDVDLNAAYVAARREVFATCRRVVLHAGPGEAYLVHRLALHGISPWAEGAVAPPEGRMVVYFRPEMAGPLQGWLALP